MIRNSEQELKPRWDVAAAFARLARALIPALLLIPGGMAAGFLPGYAETSLSDARFDFNIPAQPIMSALDAYSAVTGRAVFYDGALAVGRRSGPVQGGLAPEAALRELLIGTGLIARATGRASFMLAPVSPARFADAAYQSYFAAVQERISRVLCEHSETRPGNVDVLIRIWIAPTGTVQHAQLLDGSDDNIGEDAFAVALRGVPVGAPPSDMPQPIMLAILARNVRGSMGCGDSGTGFR